MHTKHKGDVAELRSATWLVENGYTVSKPVSEDSRYDFIADDGDELHRLQVKSSHMEDGVVKFSTCDIRGVRGEPERKTYSKDEIDAFFVYSPELGSFYWVPVEDAPETEMWLRVEEPESKYTATSQINWSSDYKAPCAR